MQLSDLWTDDQPLPKSWEAALQSIHGAGANGNLVEAERLRLQTALLTMQAKVALYTEDQAQHRADQESNAAAGRSAATDQIAKSLRIATWILAGATVALVLATLAFAVRVEPTDRGAL